MGNAPPSRSNLNVFQLINAEILGKTFISYLSIFRKNLIFLIFCEMDCHCMKLYS